MDIVTVKFRRHRWLPWRRRRYVDQLQAVDVAIALVAEGFQVRMVGAVSLWGQSR